MNHIQVPGAAGTATEPLPRRIDQLVREDRIAELVELIAPREVGEQALADPELERSLVDALGVVYWQDPARAESFYAFLTHHGARGEHHRRFARVRDAQASWVDVRKRAPCPGALDRLVRLSLAVPEERRRELRAELHADIERDPRSYERFFAGFDRVEDSVLVAHLRDCLDVEGAPERIPLEDRAADSRKAADAAFAAVDRALRGFRRKLFWGTLVAPAVLGAVMYAAIRDPEWLSLGVVGLSGNFWLLVLGAYNGGYRRLARPALFDLARAHGIGEAAMTRWVVDHRKALPRLDAQEGKLEHDATLHLGALVHASAVGRERLREIYGDALHDPPPLSAEERVARMSDDERATHEARERARRKQNTRREVFILLAVLGGIALLCAVAVAAMRL